MALPQESKILIVGGGCFGISTAYHLLRRGFMDVTVIDRSDILPAKDAASNDFNRIVRTSYADHFYSNLAKEAIESWKKDAADLWGDSYHESGVVVLESLGNAPGSFADEAYKNDLKQGIRVRKLENQKEIAQMFPPGTTVSFHECKGYMSYDSGWADAGKAIGLMTSKVASMGGKIIPGKTVKALLRTNGTRTSGVECTDGSVFEADLVVIATGSWTPSTFPDLDLGEKCLATGQCVAMVQLSPEEANAYRRIPVVLAFNTGFYIFPPTESNVMKMAFHRGGYTHSIGGISTPRTLASAENGLAIPKEVLGEFREHFRNTFPELSEKPFSSTRLCWYNDTPDGDWIIGRHPNDSSLMFATGGSGHAFKFLPVIGRVVADAIQGSLGPDVARKFAFDRDFKNPDKSREGLNVPKELIIDQLCGAEDLAM